MAFTVEGCNSDKFKSVGLHEKHAVATGNLRNISAFAWRRRETKKTCVKMDDLRTFQMHTDI
jgi:hypothetical protein